MAIITGTYDVDLLVGTAEADTILGLRENDTLFGDAGADLLDGGARDDSLVGGIGSDTLFGDSGNDYLSGGSGTDVLDGGVGTDVAGYRENTGPVRIDLVAGTASFPGTSWVAEVLTRIEGAETGSGNDTLIGDGGDNLFTAGAGRDSLLGGGGNDVLDGGAGIDTVNGGAGFDTASFASSAVATTVDLVAGRSWATGSTGARDILVSIEAATGGSDNDRLIGSALANRLDGGAGADSLVGGGGADTLVGGTGQDTLRGGAGDDIVLVDPARGQILGGGEILPDDGRDIYDGGAGSDTLMIESALWREVPGTWGFEDDYSFYVTAAVDLASGTLRTSFSSAVDRLVSIENVTTADGEDTITGGAWANIIRTGDGANIVHAGDGNDTVYGGFLVWTNDGSGRAGDSLEGGSGDDLIYGIGSWDAESFVASGAYGGSGIDTLIGGSGNDTLCAGGPGVQYGSGNVVMTGGTGADEFHLIDALAANDSAGVSFFPSQTITDFNAAAGDRIIVAMVESGASISFVGEADGNALALDEAGYTVEGGDTVLRVWLGDTDSLGREFLTITLHDYTGGLTADDLAFA